LESEKIKPFKDLIQKAKSIRVVKVFGHRERHPLAKKDRYNPIHQVSIWVPKILASWKRWGRTFPELPQETSNVVRHTHIVSRLAVLSALFEESLGRRINWKMLSIQGTLHEDGEVMHEIERDLKNNNYKEAEFNAVKKLYQEIPGGQEVIKYISLFEGWERPNEEERFTLRLLKACDRLAALEELITNWDKINIERKELAKEKIISILCQLSEYYDLFSTHLFMKGWRDHIRLLVPEAFEVKKLFVKLKKGRKIPRREIEESVFRYLTAIVEDEGMELKEKDEYIYLDSNERKKKSG